MRIEEFRIDVPDDELTGLRRRLHDTRWPGEMEGVGWAYGLPEYYLRELVARWAEDYDWRAQERALNAVPQFRATVDGVGIHFAHVRGRGPAPLPLVITHGWPSSYIEWMKVVGPLTDPAAHGGDPRDAFDVVLPSLPGYGFSDVPTRPGMSPRRIAALWVELMAGLGYERFAAQGCDWGAFVTANLGLGHPDRLVGIHMGLLSLTGIAVGEAPASDREDYRAYADRVRRWRKVEHGYVAIQSTKPQTLAYGLTDSPAGLAAWIAEKWWGWSDNDGDLDSVISTDDLLTNISIYWHTRTINSANRLYYESPRDPVALAPGQRVGVPAGFLFETAPAADSPPSVAGAPRFGAPPRARGDLAFDVHRWTEVGRGGHFPALEIPEVFVDEVREFFRPLRGGG